MMYSEHPDFLDREPHSSEQLLAILSSIGDAVITVDSQLRITFMNREAEVITEHRALGSVGKNLFEVFTFPSRQSENFARKVFETVLNEAIQSELPDPTALVGKYGAKILIGDSVAPIIDIDGSVSGLVIVFRSVADREEATRAQLRADRQLQAALQESQRRERKHVTDLDTIAEMLRRSNEELERFAYVTSHDLQEPLRTIMLETHFFELESKIEPDLRTMEFVSLIRRTARRMNTLVEDILVYSRANNKDGLTIGKTSSREALDRALSDLNGSIRESGVTVVLSECFPEVLCDPLRLQRVFQNLISNAIKYRKPNGNTVIRISAGRLASDWLFSVQDNRTGFNSDQAARIFDVFKRLHGEEISGTGIGLATCKTLVEQQGGRIWAEAVKDVGATFFFTLRSALEMELPLEELTSSDPKTLEAQA